MLLKILRAKIDDLDYQIHDLLNKRAQIANAIGAEKYAQDGLETHFYHPNREQQILEKICTHNQGPLSNKAVHRIFHSIMFECRQLQYKTYLPPQSLDLIGIQGLSGSFAEAAALNLVKKNNLEKYQLIYLLNSENVVREIELGNIHLGVIAITNSIGGLVEESLAALAKYRCQIKDRIAIDIEQNLLVLPHINSADIKSIHSHPHALKQTQNFLRKNFPHCEIIIAADTAEAARQLSAGELPDTAAVIGSSQCSSLYKLKVLNRAIQDQRKNVTEFLILANPNFE